MKEGDLVRVTFPVWMGVIHDELKQIGIILTTPGDKMNVHVLLSSGEVWQGLHRSRLEVISVVLDSCEADNIRVIAQQA